jgi:hypothetical protein
LVPGFLFLASLQTRQPAAMAVWVALISGWRLQGKAPTGVERLKSSLRIVRKQTS